MKNFILSGIVTLLLIALGYGIYTAGKNSTVRQQASPMIIPSTSPSTTPSPSSTSSISDNELIKQALLHLHDWNEDVVTVTVSTNDGKYASGTATADGGGGYFYTVKVDGQWNIVADGNGMIDCEKLTAYPDYPATLISTCYIPATGKIIKR